MGLEIFKIWGEKLIPSPPLVSNILGRNFSKKRTLLPHPIKLLSIIPQLHGFLISSPIKILATSTISYSKLRS
jgi:hypothetical protein